MSSMFIREVSIAEFREKFMKLFPARSFICCCCIQASTIFGGGITKIIRRSTTTSSSSFSRGIIVIKFWYIFSWRFFNILQINSAFSSRLLSTFKLVRHLWIQCLRLLHKIEFYLTSSHIDVSHCF